MNTAIAMYSDDSITKLPQGVDLECAKYNIMTQYVENFTIITNNYF
jgi:hypothetical protein